MKVNEKTGPCYDQSDTAPRYRLGGIHDTFCQMFTDPQQRALPEDMEKAMGTRKLAWLEIRPLHNFRTRIHFYLTYALALLMPGQCKLFLWGGGDPNELAFRICDFAVRRVKRHNILT